MDTSDIQEAFRRGVRGATPTGKGDGEALAPPGPNEALLLALDRLPGLSDPRAAYETGRALRMVIRLFDQAGAPISVGRQFIDNLGAAVMTYHMRKRPHPWGAADTADMFVELYDRILQASPAELEKVRRSVIDYAVAPAENPQGAQPGLAALFRRRRAAAQG